MFSCFLCGLNCFCSVVMRTVIQPGVRGRPVLIPAIGTVALFICAWTALSSSHFLSVHNVCTCLMNIYPCSSRKQRLFACIWIFVHDRCVWVGKGGGGNVCCICLKLKFISHHGTTVPLWTIESFSHALFNILLSFTIIYHKFIIISNSRLNLVITLFDDILWFQHLMASGTLDIIQSLD